MATKPEIESRVIFKGRNVITYGHCHNRQKAQVKNLDERDFFRSASNHSLFSMGSRKRLKKYLNNWLDTIRIGRTLFNQNQLTPLSKHTFITLTLPSMQRHCDKVIKREILNGFLIELKREYDVSNYLWKAEPQKNGNIHFHLLTSKYIDAIELMLIWNFHCNKLGYVDEFKSKHSKWLANSTDVHSLRSIKDVTAYIAKYMGKLSAVRPICGVTYGCSDSLRELKSLNLSCEGQMAEYYRMMKDSTEWSIVQGSHFTMLSLKNYWNLRPLPDFAKDELASLIQHNIAMLTDR